MIFLLYNEVINAFFVDLYNNRLCIFALFLTCGQKMYFKNAQKTFPFQYGDTYFFPLLLLNLSSFQWLLGFLSCCIPDTSFPKALYIFSALWSFIQALKAFIWWTTATTADNNNHNNNVKSQAANDCLSGLRRKRTTKIQTQNFFSHELSPSLRGEGWLWEKAQCEKVKCKVHCRKRLSRERSYKHVWILSYSFD